MALPGRLLLGWLPLSGSADQWSADLFRWRQARFLLLSDVTLTRKRVPAVGRHAVACCNYITYAVHKSTDNPVMSTSYKTILSSLGVFWSEKAVPRVKSVFVARALYFMAGFVSLLLAFFVARWWIHTQPFATPPVEVHPLTVPLPAGVPDPADNIRTPEKNCPRTQALFLMRVCRAQAPSAVTPAIHSAALVLTIAPYRLASRDGQDHAMLQRFSTPGILLCFSGTVALSAWKHRQPVR